jgi:MFS family permease
VTGRTALARIGVLMGAVFIDMMGFLLVHPLLPFYATELGATATIVGLLVAAHPFAKVTTAPLWGRLSDRWGRRPVILLGLGTAVIAYLLFGIADSLWLLMASRLVQGASGGIVGVIQAYVSDVVETEERAKALGWLTAASSAGVALGPAIGYFAVKLGEQAPGFVAAGLALVNVLFAWRFLSEPEGVERPLGKRRRLRHAVVDVFRHPGAPAHRMIWIYAGGMMAFMAVNGILALYLGERFGVTKNSIGLFYVYFGVLGVLMRAVILGPAVNAWGEVRVLQLGALSLLLGQLLLPTASSLLVLALLIPLMPIGTAMLFPATTSQVSRYASRGYVGEMLGVQQAFGGVAQMIGPIWAGVVFQHLGVQWPFWLAAVLMAGAVAVTLSVPRPTPRAPVTMPVTTSPTPPEPAPRPVEPV